jgi:hypothetical protein
MKSNSKGKSKDEWIEKRNDSQGQVRTDGEPDTRWAPGSPPVQENGKGKWERENQRAGTNP